MYYPLITIHLSALHLLLYSVPLIQHVTCLAHIPYIHRPSDLPTSRITPHHTTNPNTHHWTYSTHSAHSSTTSPTRTYTIHTLHLLITPTVTPLPHPLTHYTSHVISTATVHTTIPIPSHMRPGKQSFTHCDTIRLQSPPRAEVNPHTQESSPHPTHHLYLNDLLIDLIIQILYRSSPYRPSRHYVSPIFTNHLSHQDRDSITRTRQFKQLLDSDKSDHDHAYILIPHNITVTHRLVLQCKGHSKENCVILIKSIYITNSSVLLKKDAYSVGNCIFTKMLYYLFYIVKGIDDYPVSMNVKIQELIGPGKTFIANTIHNIDINLIPIYFIIYLLWSYQMYSFVNQ